MHLRITSSGTTKHALHTVNGRRGVAGGHGANKEEEDQSRGSKNNKLALGRAGLAVLSPGAACRGGVLAHLVSTQLVPDETEQSDRVTKELKGGDGGVPDHHGGNDQEDILEDTAEGHDQGRGLANL